MPAYDEEYFMRGVEAGVSNYTNYSWKKELTIPMAKRFVNLLGIQPNETVLDWACARGFFVKALRCVGIESFGYDISDWAIKNCDPDVSRYVTTALDPSARYDHICGKDFFEHVLGYEMEITLNTILGMARRSVLFIVPLSRSVGGDYIRREDNMDATHIVRWPLETWLDFIQSRIGDERVSVSGSWHYPGLKPSSFTHIKSCGFLLIRKHHETNA